MNAVTAKDNGDGTSSYAEVNFRVVADSLRMAKAFAEDFLEGVSTRALQVLAWPAREEVNL